MTVGLETRSIAGMPFARATLDDAVAAVCRLAVDGEQADVHLLNAYSIALGEKDARFRECLLHASCNFPDGKPISLISRIFGNPLFQVRGPSLFEQVMDTGRSENLRHYLLGSTPETLLKLKLGLERRYPGVSIVGTMSPPFRQLSDEELRAQDDLLKSSKPQIVWVGLGTPKQDFEAQRLAAKGFLAVAVGAAFDFSAGTKREAPSWMTAVGLEWVYRLLSEPRRLWRRYLIGNAVFLNAVARHGFRER